MTVRHPHHHGHDEASDRRGRGPGRGAGEPRVDHPTTHHSAVDHGLHDHGGAGVREPIGRPTILSITCAAGERVSKIRRADGTTFTVIVPRGGIDRPWGTTRPGQRWVHEDGAPRRVPADAVARLAARVGLDDGPVLELLSDEG
jgi:hypothetical protein